MEATRKLFLSFCWFSFVGVDWILLNCFAFPSDFLSNWALLGPSVTLNVFPVFSSAPYLSSINEYVCGCGASFSDSYVYVIRICKATVITDAYRKSFSLWNVDIFSSTSCNCICSWTRRVYSWFYFHVVRCYNDSLTGSG